MDSMNDSPLSTFRDVAVPSVLTYVTDRAGAVRYVSDELRREFDLSAFENLSDGLVSLVHAEDRPGAAERWHSSMGSGRDYRDTHRMRMRSGELRWMMERARIASRDGDGIDNWFGTLVDVTKERDFEDAMARAVASSTVHAVEAEARAHFAERLMDASDDCIKVLDLEGRLLSMSPNGQRALRIGNFATVEGSDWLAFWSEADRGAAKAAMKAARNGGKGRFTGLYFVGDEERWWDVTVTPILDRAENPEQLLVISRDVTLARTDHRRLEEAYARERRIAVRLQEASLSAILPKVDHLYLSAEYRPAGDEALIGGDWYDAFRLDDGRVGLTVGDVLGHGLDAAVIMGKVRQAMRAVALVYPDVNAMLDVADRTVRDHSSDSYATAMAGIFDPEMHEYVFASAGHPGPVLRHPDGRIEEFTSPGLLLGMRPRGEVESVRLTAPPGSSIVFYTDGLSEATRDAEEGSRRIHAALEDPAVAGASNPAYALVEHVLAEKPSSDDVAVLVVEVGPSRRFGDQLRPPTRTSGNAVASERKREVAVD